MKGFIDIPVYIYGKGIIKTNIGIENDKIKYIGNDSTNIEKICDINGIMVAGFIDEHIHGCGGYDTMDANKLALETISQNLAKEGTTSFLATTMTQDENKIIKTLSVISKYTNTDLGGANLIGCHLEGPFISEKYCGAQPKEYIKSPTIPLMENFINVSRETIKIVTYAPENDTNNTLLKYLISKNITPSAGHSKANFDTIQDSLNNGLKCITHTFNAQSPIHHRDIGVAGSALLFNELATEIICDGIHLSYPAIKLLIKNKPKDKIILITDSIRAKWIDSKISELGGQTVYINNGKATLENGTIAGSILKMNNSIKNLVTKAGVPFTDAIDYATYNPAKNLNMLDTIGTIEEGKLANLTVIDKDFNITLTMVNGKVIFKI
ncbi:MAG: N-acetylglucosamine-6-phosphate deacetylase [Clostridia bacterium]|nr:N-acetylglucosamine-6-phosphate deacetylase [Clostridia bacterium]